MILIICKKYLNDKYNSATTSWSNFLILRMRPKRSKMGPKLAQKIQSGPHVLEGAKMDHNDKKCSSWSTW